MYLHCLYVILDIIALNDLIALTCYSVNKTDILIDGLIEL